ncbi:hypothetical protein THARTR1_09826 [Trichoderma harzianum]|uniref:Uncharacterized protein n=1 Tax=Trichoderma harzianum TaxID=5544 RepID=A0A2K0TVE3_TRIHA|nr:hypothetical protein THARTR1_09826 [Trichoderma harzianum]
MTEVKEAGDAPAPGPQDLEMPPNPHKQLLDRPGLAEDGADGI